MQKLSSQEALGRFIHTWEYYNKNLEREYL